MALQLLAHPKWQNGKRYCYYSIAEPYRENGKNKKRILYRVGTLTATQVDKIRSLLRLQTHSALELIDPKQVECLASHQFLDVSVFDQLWKEVGFRDLLPSGRGKVELSTLLEILVINRCADPKSKLGVTRWFPSTALDRLLDVPCESVSETRLYRSLPRIEKHHEKMEAQLLATIQRIAPSSGASLYFYDLTSSYFEGEEVSLGAFSKHSKDHRPDCLQVVLGLLMNEKGLPFSWEVFAGNQGDAPTLKRQLKKFQQRFGIEEATLVFDRGFLSNDNLNKVQDAGYHYVTGLDAPQIETLLSIYPQTWLETINADSCEGVVSKQRSWHRFDETQFYAPLGIVNDRQTILLFDVARYRRSVLRRQEKIEAFKSWVHKHNEWLATFKKDAKEEAIGKDVEEELAKRHLSPYLRYALQPIRTENQTFTRKKNNPYPSQGNWRSIRSFRIEIIHETNRHPLDGIFALITSKDSPLSSEEMIHAYRQKYLIEHAFRNMKSILKLRPWFVYKEEHVRAHYTICVLAYFLERLLDLKLEEHDLKDQGWTLGHFKDELQNVRMATLQIGKTKRTVLQKPPSDLSKALEKIGLEKALKLPK